MPESTTENPYPERDKDRYKARYTNSLREINYRGVSICLNRRLTKRQNPAGEFWMIKKQKRIKKEREKNDLMIDKMIELK